MASVAKIEPVASSGSQRRESRVASLFRPILLETDSFRGIGILRNISVQGMMVQVYSELKARTWVTAYLGEEPVLAQVVWAKGGMAGFQLAKPIDVRQTLRRFGSCDLAGRAPRPPRLETNCSAHVHLDRTMAEVLVLNLSQRGALLETALLRAGGPGFLDIDGLPRRKFEVRWTRSGQAGVNFFTSLTIQEIAEWAFARNTVSMKTEWI